MRCDHAERPNGPSVSRVAGVEDPPHPMGANCVFLRPDRKCGLQVASIAAGEHPWRFKPFYCALHPITFDEGIVVLAEGNELYVDGGSCNRPAPGVLIPVYKLFEMEMKLALGEAGYAELEARADGEQVCECVSTGVRRCGRLEEERWMAALFAVICLLLGLGFFDFALRHITPFAMSYGFQLIAGPAHDLAQECAGKHCFEVTA